MVKILFFGPRTLDLSEIVEESSGAPRIFTKPSNKAAAQTIKQAQVEVKAEWEL